MKSASVYREYHPMSWWRKRLKELDKKRCETAKELQDTLTELTLCSKGLMRAQIVNRVIQYFSELRSTATPVDTGRARAGWQMGVDEGVLNYVPPVIKRTTGKSGGILPEYAAMIQDIQAINADLTKADVIYIVNNVEYILMLNAGWSKKQPGGFIDNFLNRLKIDLSQMAAEFSGRRA